MAFGVSVMKTEKECIRVSLASDEDIRHILNEENWLVQNAYNMVSLVRLSKINFLGHEQIDYNHTVANTIQALKERLDLANQQIDELVEILENETA